MFWLSLLGLGDALRGLFLLDAWQLLILPGLLAGVGVALVWRPSARWIPADGDVGDAQALGGIVLATSTVLFVCGVLMAKGRADALRGILRAPAVSVELTTDLPVFATERVEGVLVRGIRPARVASAPTRSDTIPARLFGHPVAPGPVIPPVPPTTADTTALFVPLAEARRAEAVLAAQGARQAVAALRGAVALGTP